MITWEGYTCQVDASDLGLSPGDCPPTLWAEGPDGVKRTFVRRAVFRPSHDGVPQGFSYPQPREDLARLGLCLVLLVHND